jgi:hypothetical protein
MLKLVYDIVQTDTKVKGTDGSAVTTSHYGKLQTIYCDNQGKEVKTMPIPKVFYCKRITESH